MAEREGMGRHGGEVRGPGRRRVRLLREKAPDLSRGGGQGGGDCGHPGEGDQTPVAHGGQAAEEWESGSDGEGRPKEPSKDHGNRRFRESAGPAERRTCPSAPRSRPRCPENRLVSGPATPTELGFDIINGPARKRGREFSGKNFPHFSQKDTIISPIFRKEKALPAQ
jgi:hypothetical protein